MYLAAAVVVAAFRLVAAGIALLARSRLGLRCRRRRRGRRRDLAHRLRLGRRRRRHQLARWLLRLKLRRRLQLSWLLLRTLAGAIVAVVAIPFKALAPVLSRRLVLLRIEEEEEDEDLPCSEPELITRSKKGNKARSGL